MAKDTPQTPEEEHEEPRVMDKRRIDPETGELRSPASEADEGTEELSEEDLRGIGEALTEIRPRWAEPQWPCGG